jgi:hypothetical protein
MKGLDAMAKPVSTLSNDVLAAFERAYAEGDLQVAEHLLRAPEVMGSRDEDDKFLERAYWDLVHSFGCEPRHLFRLGIGAMILYPAQTQRIRDH